MWSNLKLETHTQWLGLALDRRLWCPSFSVFKFFYKTHHNLDKGQNPPLVIEKIKRLKPVRQSAEAIKESSDFCWFISLGIYTCGNKFVKCNRRNNFYVYLQQSPHIHREVSQSVSPRSRPCKVQIHWRNAHPHDCDEIYRLSKHVATSIWIKPSLPFFPAMPKWEAWIEVVKVLTEPPLLSYLLHKLWRSF